MKRSSSQPFDRKGRAATREVGSRLGTDTESGAAATAGSGDLSRGCELPGPVARIWGYRRALAPTTALALLATTMVMAPVTADPTSASAEASSQSSAAKSRAAKTSKMAGAPAGRDAQEQSRSADRNDPTDLPKLGEAAQAKPAQKPAPSTDAGSASTSGVAPSLYTGSYYRPAYESFRRCVIQRESRGQYTITNSSSGASGAYQFMVRTSNEVARMMGRPDLVGRPAATWTRAEQDQAFYTLFDHGRGISHWGGSCG